MLEIRMKSIFIALYVESKRAEIFIFHYFLIANKVNRASDTQQLLRTE